MKNIIHTTEADFEIEKQKLAEWGGVAEVAECRAALTELGNSFIRLRASHTELLVAARAALNVLQNLPLGGDRDVNEALKAAIAHAEEPAS